MIPIHFAVGSKVFVRREGIVLPAYIVGFLRSTSLVWVQINGKDPTLVERAEILREPEQTVEEGLPLWETELIDVPEKGKPRAR